MPKKKQPGPRHKKRTDKKTQHKVASNQPRVKTRSDYPAQMTARIQLLAKKVGSKAELDRLLGYGRGAIAGYCREPYKVPGGSLLARIVKATECDAMWLLTGQGEPFPNFRGTEHLIAIRQHFSDVLAALDTAIESVESIYPAPPGSGQR